MRGRKSIPTALKIIRGNPGGRPLNKNEPDPEKIVPDCPRYLDKVARASWEYDADVLQRMKVMTEADRGILEVRSIFYSRMYHSLKRIEKEGDVVTTFKVDALGNQVTEKKPHPSALRLEKAAEIYLKTCPMLGMDPSSRSKLKVDNEEIDPLESFIKRKRSQND